MSPSPHCRGSYTNSSTSSGSSFSTGSGADLSSQAKVNRCLRTVADCSITRPRFAKRRNCFGVATLAY